MSTQLRRYEMPVTRTRKYIYVDLITKYIDAVEMKHRTGWLTSAR